MASLTRLFTYKCPKHMLTRCYNKIVITDDGSTIVALHRDQNFPYEFSKPLPEEPQKNTGILRMENIEEVRRVFVETKPEIARKQLASLTLTTEHRWFPRARDKKAKKTEMDRPFFSYPCHRIKGKRRSPLRAPVRRAPTRIAPNLVHEGH